MNNLPLQPLLWADNTIDDYIDHRAQGAGVSYRVCYFADKFRVYWVDSMGGSDGNKEFDSLDELKHWVNTDHYPHKMQPYVKPMPTWIDVNERLPEQNTEVLVRYHAHFDDEDVKEFDVCIAFFYSSIFDVKDQHFYTQRIAKVTHWMPIPEFSTMQNNKGE